MAIIFRSLRNLARKTPRTTTPFFTPSPSPTPSPSTSSSSPIFITSSYPFHGPLFLSFPPSKLLQSATPLFYFQSHLLPLPQSPKFPINLVGLRSYCQVPQPALGLQLLNLPNLISISRLLSGPLLAWMIMNDMYTPAFIGLILSGATDWLDGYVARKMGINSVVGSYLDPLADKVLIGCVAIAMVERGLLHSGLVALVVMRDVALVGGAVYIRANHLGGSKSRRSWSEFFDLDGVSPRKVEPLMISKVNTCFQLALVTGALLQPEFGTPETDSYITYLSWVVATTTMASTAAYGMRYLRTPRS